MNRLLPESVPSFARIRNFVEIGGEPGLLGEFILLGDFILLKPGEVREETVWARKKAGGLKPVRVDKTTGRFTISG